MSSTLVSYRSKSLAIAILLPLLFIFSGPVARCAEPDGKMIPIMPQVIHLQKLVQTELEKGNLTDGQAKVFGAELARLTRVLSAGDKDAGHKVGLPSIGPTVGRDLRALEGRVNLAVMAAQKKSKSSK